jgi:hypothetical protein
MMNNTILEFYKMSLSLVFMFLTPMLLIFGIRLLLSKWGTPEKRTQIKETVSGFISFLIATPIGILMYGFLIKISESISLYFVGENFSVNGLTNFSNAFAKVLQSKTMIAIYNKASIFSTITISMQRILLVLGALLIPVTFALIFLSTSNQIKNFGQSMMMFFGLVIFLPVLDSLIFQCAEIAITLSTSAEYIVIGSYWLVGFMNVFLLIAAFLISKSGANTIVQTVVQKVKEVRIKK